MTEQKELEQSLESLDKSHAHLFISDDIAKGKSIGIWYPVVSQKQFAAMCNRGAAQISNRMRHVGKNGEKSLTTVFPFKYGAYAGPELIVLDKKALAYQSKCFRRDKRNGRNI